MLSPAPVRCRWLLPSLTESKSGPSSKSLCQWQASRWVPTAPLRNVLKARCTSKLSIPTRRMPCAVVIATGMSYQPDINPSAHTASRPPPVMQPTVPAATATTPEDPANQPASRLRPELRLVRSCQVPSTAAPMLLMRAGGSVPAPVRGSAIRTAQATTLPLSPPAADRSTAPPGCDREEAYVSVLG